MSGLDQYICLVEKTWIDIWILVREGDSFEVLCKSRAYPQVTFSPSTGQFMVMHMVDNNRRLVTAGFSTEQS